MDYQTTDAEIKNLKEKLKGNVALIRAKDVIQNDIIAEMKTIYHFLTVAADKKSIIKEFEEQVMVDKNKTLIRPFGQESLLISLIPKQIRNWKKMKSKTGFYMLWKLIK